MKRERFLAACLCLCLPLAVATGEGAAEPACPNAIGVYFDLGANVNCGNPAPYAMLNMYLIATGITEASGMSGWEAHVYFNPVPAAGVTYTYAGVGAVNPLTAPDFQVGLGGGPLPCSPTMLLLTMSTFYLGGPLQIGVGPITTAPPSFSPPSPGYAAGHDPAQLVALQSSSTFSPIPGVEGAYWVAGIYNDYDCPGINCGDFPPATDVTIDEVQQYEPSGAPASPYAEQFVRFQGVISSAWDCYGDQAAYVQDATGGIAAIGPVLSSRHVGDGVTMVGRVTVGNGELVLMDVITAFEQPGAAPEPLLLSVAQALDYEQVGRLVNVYGRVGTPSIDGFNLEAGTTVLPVHAAASTGIVLGNVGIGDQYSVTGILRVRDGVIQLWPRQQSDLVEVASPYFFQIGIDATVAGYTDTGNLLGSVFGATDGFDALLDTPEPPHAPSGYLSAYFSHPEWGLPIGEGFTKDLRLDYDLNFEKKTWPFSVLTDRAGTVTLTFSPSFTSNTGYDIVVEDLTTGGLTFLFPELTYSYPSAGTNRRDFRIHVGRYYPVPAVTPAVRSVAAGWSLLGMPLVPLAGQETVGANVLDDVSGYAWLFEYLGNAGYAVVGSDAPMARGKGLWIANLADFTWDMEGVRDIGYIDVPIVNGWNLHGYPLWFTLPLDAVRVVHGGTVYSYPEAVAANLVSGSVYDWDTAASDYLTAVDLQAWRGYWLAGYADGLTLRYNYRYLYSVGKSAPRLAKMDVAPAKATAADWRLKLRVADAAGRRGWATLGMAASASDGFDASGDLPVPPASPRGPAPVLAFAHPEWQLSTGDGFAIDLRDAGAASQVWRARVTVPQPGAATITWNPGDLPEGVDLNLYIPAQNRVIVRSLREQASATLTVPAEGIDVEFRTPDWTTDVSDDRVAASALRAVPNPFNPGTELRFSLPRDGMAQVRIFDVRGRLVRALGGERLPSGERTLTWDGKDAQGVSAPSGLYFCRLYLDGAAQGQTAKLSLVK